MLINTNGSVLVLSSRYFVSSGCKTLTQSQRKEGHLVHENPWHLPLKILFWSECSQKTKVNRLTRMVMLAWCHSWLLRWQRYLYPVYTIQPVDNRLYRVNKHPSGCQTGLTTVLNEQPLFVQPVVKLGCTTGLTTGCIYDTTSCQTGLTTG